MVECMNEHPPSEWGVYLLPMGVAKALGYEMSKRYSWDVMYDGQTDQLHTLKENMLCLAVELYCGGLSMLDISELAELLKGSFSQVNIQINGCETTSDFVSGSGGGASDTLPDWVGNGADHSGPDTPSGWDDTGTYIQDKIKAANEIYHGLYEAMDTVDNFADALSGMGIAEVTAWVSATLLTSGITGLIAAVITAVVAAPLIAAALFSAIALGLVTSASIRAFLDELSASEFVCTLVESNNVSEAKLGAESVVRAAWVESAGLTTWRINVWLYFLSLFALKDELFSALFAPVDSELLDDVIIYEDGSDCATSGGGSPGNPTVFIYDLNDNLIEQFDSVGDMPTTYSVNLHTTTKFIHPTYNWHAYGIKVRGLDSVLVRLAMDAYDVTGYTAQNLHPSNAGSAIGANDLTLSGSTVVFEVSMLDATPSMSGNMGGVLATDYTVLWHEEVAPPSTAVVVVAPPP